MMTVLSIANFILIQEIDNHLFATEDIRIRNFLIITPTIKDLIIQRYKITYNLCI